MNTYGNMESDTNYDLIKDIISEMLYWIANRSVMFISAHFYNINNWNMYTLYTPSRTRYYEGRLQFYSICKVFYPEV
jgi:hypothetical protein